MRKSIKVAIRSCKAEFKLGFTALLGFVCLGSSSCNPPAVELAQYLEAEIGIPVVFNHSETDVCVQEQLLSFCTEYLNISEKKKPEVKAKLLALIKKIQMKPREIEKRDGVET